MADGDVMPPRRKSATPPFPVKNNRRQPGDEYVPMIQTSSPSSSGNSSSNNSPPKQTSVYDEPSTRLNLIDQSPPIDVINPGAADRRRRLSNSVRRLTRATIILSIFLACFVALATVFIILFFINQRLLVRPLEESDDASSATGSQAGSGYRSGCKNFDCMVSLGKLMQSINKSADPCEDFYTFACGRFIEESQLDSSESSRSAWDLNSQTIDKTLEAILNTDRNISDIKSVTEQKAFRFFLSCLDIDRINERGKAEAANLLKNIGVGDWYVYGSKMRGVLTGTSFPLALWRLEDSVVNLITHATFTSGVIGLVIHQDQRNVSRNIVTIDAPNLTLGGRQLYLSNSSNTQLFAAYFNYVYKLANVFPLPEKRHKINNSSIWGIINFEKKIAEIAPPAAVYEHVADNYRVITIPELQIECPIIDWATAFRRIMTKVGYNSEHDDVPDLQEIAIFGDYLPKLARLISQHIATVNGAVHIHNYLTFVGLHSHGDDLGEEISLLNTEFENVLSGLSTPPPATMPHEIMTSSDATSDATTESSTTTTTSTTMATSPSDYDSSAPTSSPTDDSPSDRLDVCRVKTKNIFGLPLSKYYVDKHFNAEAKQVATALVEDIKSGFMDELEDPAVDWMDDQTKKQAKHKANKMVLNVGYPDILMNQAETDEMFADLEVTYDYVGNILSNYRFSLKKAFEELNKSPDRAKWEMDPIESNAYYTTSANKIVIPAAILQIPFFNPNWIDAINYGAIGTVIGHEITHGFDVAGSQFDASGQIVDWWDASTRQHFTDRTACISEQYSGYEVGNGLKIDGEMTLSENIADNGGLTAAYRAFRRKVGAKAHDKSLPGFDLTDEQVFFLSFAQVWCQNIRPEQLANDVETDTHSPNKFRVIGALSNSHEFAQAYQCPVGSFMNPSKKCKVW